MAIKELLNNNFENIMPENILSLRLNDDAYLNENFIKPDSTMSNLLYRKWVIMGNQLTFKEKIKIIFSILKIGKFNSIKNIAKIILRKVS